MTTFCAMTWNVENLFRPSQGASQSGRDQYAAKLQLIAGVIQQQSPDVIAFQEVGGEEPMADLQQQLGGGWPHRAVSAFPDGRGIRNAFLSRVPIDGVAIDIVDFPAGPATAIQTVNSHGCVVPVTRMGRGALRIRVQKDGFTTDLINVHLKSKLLSFPRPGGGTSFSPTSEDERAQVAGVALMKRAAEAITVRTRANEILNGSDRSPLLILGDFNDVPDAQTSMLFQGPEGSQIGTATGASSFHRPDKGDDVRLFNLGALIPDDRRFSRIHSGQGELLDQIFASVEFFPAITAGRRRLPVVNSLIDFATQLPSVSSNAALRTTEIAPDHAPVIATFEV